MLDIHTQSPTTGNQRTLKLVTNKRWGQSGWEGYGKKGHFSQETFLYSLDFGSKLMFYIYKKQN